MNLKKTRAELRQMALDYRNKIVDGVKKQDGKNLLIGGLVVGVIFALFMKAILTLLFLTVVCVACFYFICPEGAVDDDVIVENQNDDDKKND